jgi:hypothetical protein
MKYHLYTIGTMVLIFLLLTVLLKYTMMVIGGLIVLAGVVSTLYILFLIYEAIYIAYTGRGLDL